MGPKLLLLRLIINPSIRLLQRKNASLLRVYSLSQYFFSIFIINIFIFLEWNVLEENFAELDCFNDVNLNGEQSEDFFSNLLSSTEVPEEPEFVPSSSSSTVKAEPNPITIRLKTVKYSKKKQPKVAEEPNTFIPPATPLTLGEALGQGEAQKILDDLLMEVQENALPEFQPMEMYVDEYSSYVDSPAESAASSSSSPSWSVSSQQSYDDIPQNVVVAPTKRKSHQRVKRIKEKLTPEMRRQRKKEQNKEAAVRYRNKMREEQAKLVKNLKTEEFRNEELMASQKDLKKEVDFVKKLLREALEARLKN